MVRHPNIIIISRKISRYLMFLTLSQRISRLIPPKHNEYVRRYEIYSSRTIGILKRLKHIIRLAPSGWKEKHNQVNDSVRFLPAVVKGFCCEFLLVIREIGFQDLNFQFYIVFRRFLIEKTSVFTIFPLKSLLKIINFTII